MRVVMAVLMAGLLAGCTTTGPTSSPPQVVSPSPAPSPSPTPTAAQPGPLIAVQSADGSQLQLLKPDGTSVASAPFATDEEVVGAGGGYLFYSSAGGLYVLDRFGSATRLADVEGVPSAAASADGSKWVWTYWTNDSEGTLTSSIWVGAPSQLGRVLATRSAMTIWSAFKVTGSRVFVSDQGVGFGCGQCGPYTYQFGGESIDLATGIAAALPGNCVGYDVAGDGTLACMLTGSGTVAVRVLFTDGSHRDFPVPSDVDTAGGVTFLGAGHDRIGFGMSRWTDVKNQDPGQEGSRFFDVMELAVSSGHMAEVRRGALPSAWLADGSLVYTDLQNHLYVTPSGATTSQTLCTCTYLGLMAP